MLSAEQELERLTTLRPIETLKKRDGDVLLWWFPGKRPDVGNRDDADRWRVALNDSPTHWSPIPVCEHDTQQSDRECRRCNGLGGWYDGDQGQKVLCVHCNASGIEPKQS